MAWNNFDRDYNPSYDGGTVGDFYVDPVNGNDSNPGTEAQPLKTLNAANTVASAGDTIKLRGGVYREQLVSKSSDAGNPIIWSRYGTEKPIISAAEPLTGFVPCSATPDQARIGSNYVNCFVKRNVLNTTFLLDDPFSANVFVDGSRSLQCLFWEGADTGDKFRQGWSHDHYLADDIITNDGNKTQGVSVIQKIKSTYVVDNYSADQLMHARVIGTVYPNIQYRADITAVDSVTKELTIDSLPSYKYAGSGNYGADRFAIVNLLPAIEQGQWGVWDNGDGTSDLYLWPANAGDETKVEISTRTYAVNATNVDYIEFYGIEFAQTTGSAKGDANPGFFNEGIAVANLSLTQNYHFVMQQCRVYGTFGTKRSRSIRLTNVDGVNVQNCRFEDAMEHFGPFFNQVQNSILARNTIYRTAQSPIAIYGGKQTVVAHNFIDDCGGAAHANKLNWYLGSHEILVFGNEFRNTLGYMTDQEASDSYVIANYMPCNDDGRGYTTQGNSNGPGTAQVRNSLFINNTVVPHPSNLTASNSINCGSTTPSAPIENSTVYWELYNNIIHGDVSPASQIASKKGTFDTSTTGIPNINNKNYSLALSDLYVDAANGDFTFANNAPVYTTVGINVKTKIDTLKPVFPQFTDWDISFDGSTIDWETPPIGALPVVFNTTGPNLKSRTILEYEIESAHFADADAGFTGWDSPAGFRDVTVTHPDQIRAEIETWRSAGAVEKIRFLMAWNGPLSFTDNTLRGPAASFLTPNPDSLSGYDLPSGGLWFAPADGYDPEIGNTELYISGMTKNFWDRVKFTGTRTTTGSPRPSYLRYLSHDYAKSRALIACRGCTFGPATAPVNPEYSGAAVNANQQHTLHVENCTLRYTSGFGANTLYARIWNTVSVGLINDFVAIYYYPEDRWIGRTAQVWIEGCQVSAMQDDPVIGYMHSDFFQVGTGVDKIDGVDAIVRYNIADMGTVNVGTQFIYSDDSYNTRQNFVVHNNIGCITAYHACAYHDPNGAGHLFCENNLFFRSGVHDGADTIQWVIVDTVPATGTAATTNGGTVTVRNNYLAKISNPTGTARIRASGNHFVNPRKSITAGNNGLTAATAQRPEEVFTGPFTRDASDMLSYNAPDIPTLLAVLKPQAGWGNGVGPSDPNKWPPKARRGIQIGANFVMKVATD